MTLIYPDVLYVAGQQFNYFTYSRFFVKLTAGQCFYTFIATIWPGMAKYSADISLYAAYGDMKLLG